MTTPPRPPNPLTETVAPGTSSLAIFTTLLMSGLFLLKGNTINVECVGCLYDPNSAAQVSEPIVNTVKETVVKSPNVSGVEYNCNQIELKAFDKPPVSPTISGDMLTNPDVLVPVMSKLASDQRQYIYDYERHVLDMINKHNALCN